MSTKPETTFYTSVHRYLPKDGLNPYREKMYNPLRGGTPDMYYSGKRELWVEYKFVIVPKHDTTMIDIGVTSLQANWLRGRYNEGRQCAVFIGCKEGGVLSLDPEQWEEPIRTDEFRNLIITRKQIAEWIIRQTMGY